MLWFKAFHIVAMVAWFAGLFYLPRLFVYHVTAVAAEGERFKGMERRLYYYIMWPAAILTTVLGVVLLSYNLTYYLHVGWMHLKLSLVLLLWIYHLYCGKILHQFAGNLNKRQEKFYRIYNELPTVLLIAIVILVVVKPF